VEPVWDFSSKKAETSWPEYKHPAKITTVFSNQKEELSYKGPVNHYAQL